MSNQLLPTEIERLKEFRFTDQQFESELSILVSELFNETVSREYLVKLQPEIHAPDQKVVASMFMKRYGFFAVLNLFAMTVFNKRLNTSLSNVSLETNENDDVWYWNPKFHFHDMTTVSPHENDRIKWRDETIKAIFRDHIHELLLLLSRLTKLSKITLWENISIYIFWLYESVLQKPEFAHLKDVIQDDFQYIVKEANGSLFGPLNHNPLTRFFHEKVYRPEYQQEIRTRTSCCLYYLTDENGERCKTCPITCKINNRR